MIVEDIYVFPELRGMSNTMEIYCSHGSISTRSYNTVIRLYGLPASINIFFPAAQCNRLIFGKGGNSWC